MPSRRWTPFMPQIWASIWTICTFRSRTTASRRWKFWTIWCAATQLIWWWWIPWRRSLELEGDMGDSHMGVQARLMSQALRKIVAVGNKSNTCIIFINQLRDKIGVMFGNPETTTGGKALKFYSSVRLDVRKIDQVKDGSEIVGSKTRVKVVKNKVAPPFKTAEFEIIFGKGISNSGCILDMAVANGYIDKSGSWFSYNGERIGQGRENAKQYLEQHPDVMDLLSDKIKAKLTHTEVAEDENPQ